MAGDDRLRELEEKYGGYEVYDNQGEKLGRIDDLFIDEDGREEYIGVKIDFLGLRSTLIPLDIVRVDEPARIMEVSETKERIKNAPTFADDEDVTPEYENRVRSYFGLEEPRSSED